MELYYRDESKDKSFEYKSKMIGGTSDDNNILDIEVRHKMQFLEISWFAIDLLSSRTWFVMVKRMYNIWNINNTSSNPNSNLPVQKVAAIQTTGAKFQTNINMFYVPVVT